MAIGFQPNYTFPNMTGGIDTLMIGTASTLPFLIPMFLFFVWMVVFLGGMFAQMLRGRTPDIPLWCTMGSLSTLLIAFPLTLKAGLIGQLTLGIVVILTIFSGLWLFLSQGRNE